LLHNSWDTG